MAPKQKNRKRKKRPNVYTGGTSSTTQKKEVSPINQIVEPIGENHQKDNSQHVVETRHSRSLVSQRTARQAHVRSEVFGRTLKIELRKLGILTGGIIIALAVLTIVL